MSKIILDKSCAQRLVDDFGQAVDYRPQLLESIAEKMTAGVLSRRLFVV
jgi:hypothetical protein